MNIYLISLVIHRGSETTSTALIVAAPDADMARHHALADTEQKWHGWEVSIGSCQQYTKQDLITMAGWGWKYAQKQVDEIEKQDRA